MLVQVRSLVRACPLLRDVDLFGVRGLPRGSKVRACVPNGRVENLSLWQAATNTSVQKLLELFATNID